MNPKLFTAKILSLLVVTAFVAGCGTKTDPTSDYSLPAGVPATENPNHVVAPLTTQSVLPGNVFRVDIPSNMNFVEGQPSSYSITVSSMLKGLSFSLQASGLPAGVSMKVISATQYEISGTVPVGTSVGSQQGEKIPVSVSAVAQGSADSMARFNSLLHSWSPTVTVFPTDKAPIVESQKIGLSVSEGDTLPVSIIVTDAGSHGTETPEIQSPFQDDSQNGEVTFVSAMPGLRMSRVPQALGNNQFKFSGTLNTKLLSIPDGKKPVTARFVVNFKSPSGLVSADEIVDVKVTRAAAAPAPAPLPQAAPVAAAAPSPAVAVPVATAPATTTPVATEPKAQPADATAQAAATATPAKKAVTTPKKKRTTKKKSTAKSPAKSTAAATATKQESK